MLSLLSTSVTTLEQHALICVRVTHLEGVANYSPSAGRAETTGSIGKVLAGRVVGLKEGRRFS